MEVWKTKDKEWNVKTIHSDGYSYRVYGILTQLSYQCNTMQNLRDVLKLTALGGVGAVFAAGLGAGFSVFVLFLAIITKLHIREF